MQINKKLIDDLIEDFSASSNKNTIDRVNLSKFVKGKKEDDLYLSFIESQDQHYITFLNFLIKKLKPKNIVELGNREGLSTLSMYDAAKKVDADFYSIDIEKDLRYCPNHMFEDKKMHFLFGDVCSLEIIKKIPQGIDILFTDTLHFDFQLRDEWRIYEHLMSDVAIVAIDDININDKRKVFEEVPYSKWDLTNLCHHNGWGIFLFERKNSNSEKETLHESIIKVWERKYEALLKDNEDLRNRSLLYKTKDFFKKIKIFYNLYTRTYNIINKKLNKSKTMKYSGTTRL